MTQIKYHRTDRQQRREIQQLDRNSLAAYQLNRMNNLLKSILPENRFYADRVEALGRDPHRLKLDSLDAIREFPLTLKSELIDDDSPAGFARNLTYSIDRYCRFHRTSGSRGRPMVVLDTLEDWAWWMETWQYVLDSAEMTAADRVLMAFSFGPFIGFWSAFDAAVERGCLVVPTGAMTTLARLELIETTGSTIVFCTPSYGLHMAEVAHQNKLENVSRQVRKIVVAGEPGGSIPAIRGRLESFWNADVVDHTGASEVGPWGFADPAGRGVYVNEAQFYPEFLSVESGQPASDGELSELILTPLGRAGSPVIRYRTGDLVRPTWQDPQPCHFVLLEGGVLGRSDDMMIIRGVNVFPTAIEQILRSFPEVVEYRMTAFKQSEMDQLKIELEDQLNEPDRIKQELQLRLGLRVEVVCVPAGTLPRFEAKGKRFVDQR